MEQEKSLDRRDVPPIDAAAPETIQTATFALG